MIRLQIQEAAYRYTKVYRKELDEMDKEALLEVKAAHKVAMKAPDPTRKYI
jgi:hypothetical protein